MNNSVEPAWPSIAAMTASAAERHPDRTAIVDGGERVSYERLYADARGFGAALVAAGVEPGDRVGVWAFNCREWIVALLGLYQAGAVLVPVNTRFKGREATDILRRARVRVLVTVTGFLGNDYVAMLNGAGEPLPDLHTVVIARGGPSGAGVPWDDFLARATAGDLAEVDRRSAALGPDDPSDVLFTSGTTGTPKGVLMTHRRTMGVATDWVGMAGLAAGDRYVLVNPFFHMFGFKGGILACVAAGATMLPQPTLDVDRVLGQVAEERVTVLPGPPALYQAILEHPGRERYDLTSLRVAVTGAARGEVGEIVLRGPTTMAGYMDDPAATEAVLSADGWLRTGDLGSLDERGCLRIAGRSKDMFIVGGFNAYPAEIEAMLLEHPGVRQAAVIGVPDERLGQVGMAFIVPRAPGLAEADVIAWCRDRMANYKVPRSVRLIDELPLTESGKVRKNALEARAAAERSG